MATPAAIPVLLGIKDLDKVLSVLKDNRFPDNQWDKLGLKLGITKPELDTIKEDKQDSKDCLKECLSCWLQQDYDINQYGKPTMTSLAAALIGMGQKAVALRIFEQSHKKLSSEIEILTKKNSSLKEELAKLKEEHRNEQLKSSHDHDENQRLSCEIESLKETSSILKEELDTTKKRLTAASQELNELNKTNPILKEERDIAKKQFRAALQDTTEERLTAALQELNELNKTNSVLKEKLDTTEKRFRAALQELNELKETLQELNVQKEKLKDSSNRERNYIILIYVLLVAFILYSSHTPKHFIAPLPGVEVIMSTDLTVVGGQSRKFDWKEYGLLLDVPSDALPCGFLANIKICVSVSGPYIYPGLENWKPASPVYWISSSREFINPIMFGIRHYVRGEVNSSVIKVVTADDSPQNVSYVFQEIPNNITVSKDYVYFSMSHFSGVEAKTSIKSDNFCGTLFSRDSSIGKNMWDYNFVIYQCSSTVGIKTEIDSQTNSSWSVEKAQMDVAFLNDSTEIELNLSFDPPMPNWKAIPISKPLRYCKKNLQDELIKSNMQFTLRWQGNDTSPTIPYDLSFSLKGAEQPEKITIITKSMEQPGIWEKYTIIIWEKYTIIILTLSPIIAIIYFCLHCCKKSTAKQPSIWEQHQMIIIIIGLIVIILSFFPDYCNKTIDNSLALLQSLAFFSLLKSKFGDSVATNWLSKQK